MFLLCGIWGGFIVAALLLVTDVSWPGRLMGTRVEEGRGCAPILGQTLSLNDARFSYDTQSCTSMALPRLGWALVASVFALICFVLRVRESLLVTIHRQEELSKRFRERGSGDGGATEG